LLPALIPKEDAVQKLCSFLTKFASLISWCHSCFDRVIFKGHLPISRPYQMAYFIDAVLKMRRADFFKKTGPVWSQRLVDHAKNYASKYGRPFERQRDVDKDAWAKELLRSQPVKQGLIGILCVMESCGTFKSAYGEGRPQIVTAHVPQRVLYYYFLDRDLGLMHVRLQTWAPFTCQIYVNGHYYVAQQMQRRGLVFEMTENAFTHLANPQEAQRFADRFAKLPWPKILERYARQVNPLLRKELKEIKGLGHYWVIDQAEYATDLLFVSKQALAGLYLRLLEFAFLTFSPQKILGYLGRAYHERFDGEVQTHYKSAREPGACIKHAVKKNRLKMYDKLAVLLRVETVINQPGDFKVFRECRHRDGSVTLGWHPMCKGVGNLPHYQKHALASNQRYLEALATVDDPTPDYNDLAQLTEARRHQGHSYAGFNPARAHDVKFLAAVAAGDHIAQGFRNCDIREELYPAATVNQRQQRRRSAAVGRLLKRLHVRGMLAKIPRTRRWRVSGKGRRIIGDVLRTYRRYNTQAA
jgi:hypothetical protein